MDNKDNKPTFNPTIAFVAVLAFIIAIVLVFTFRSNSDNETTAPEQPDPVNQVEQPITSDPQPDSDPEPPAQPDPEPEELVDPTPPTPPVEGELPVDWDQLTPAEKTDRNPFDCDIQTQWISAEDGTCIDKSSAVGPTLLPVTLQQPFRLSLDSGRLQLEGRIDLDCHPAKHEIVDSFDSNDTRNFSRSYHNRLSAFAEAFNNALNLYGLEPVQVMDIDRFDTYDLPDSHNLVDAINAKLDAINANLDRYDMEICKVDGEYTNVGGRYKYERDGFLAWGDFCPPGLLASEIALVSSSGERHGPLRIHWLLQAAVSCLLSEGEIYLENGGVLNADSDYTYYYFGPSGFSSDFSHFELTVGGDLSKYIILPGS